MRLGRLGFGLVSVFGGSPGYPIEFSDLPRHDAGTTTTTRGSDKQGRRRGGDAATTGRRMRKEGSDPKPSTLILASCCGAARPGFPSVRDGK